MTSIYFIFEFFIKSYVFLMSVQVGWACDPNIGLSNSYLVEYLIHIWWSILHLNSILGLTDFK